MLSFSLCGFLSMLEKIQQARYQEHKCGQFSAYHVLVYTVFFIVAVCIGSSTYVLLNFIILSVDMTNYRLLQWKHEVLSLSALFL